MSDLIDKIKPIARVRELLCELEEDLGLHTLSAGERDVLYALVAESTDADGIVRTSSVRNHVILSDMSDPTFYRHVASLVEKEVLALAPGRQRGIYRLSGCLNSDLP